MNYEAELTLVTSFLDPSNLRQLQTLVRQSLQQVHEGVLQIVVALKSNVEHLPQ